MEVIVASLAMLSVVLVVVRIVKGKRLRRDVMMRSAVFVMSSTVFSILFDMLASGSCIMLEMLTIDLIPSAMALWIMSSSMSGISIMKWGLGIVLILGIAVFVYQLGRTFFEMKPHSSGQILTAASLAVSFMTLLYVLGLIFRMKNVKALMRDGTIWAVLCMAVDMAYFCFIIMAVAFVHSGWTVAGVFMLGGVISAIGIRVLSDDKFIIWQKQEMLIVESMKLMSVTSASDSSHIDDVYKELYDRILTYFEIRKPYLDSDLTINDLVKDLYSNKLYISRAISQFTGRNFCQFVNYYRIMHSIEYFRKNPEMRINELATMNGFNSVVSYSMAFRLFMGETPSEWFRKERSRLLKKGK